MDYDDVENTTWPAANTSLATDGPVEPQNNNTIALVIQVIVIPVIIFGNGLILVAIKKSSSLWKTTYYLIGNLAVADFLFGCMLGIRVIISLTHRFTTFVCILVNFIGLIPTGCSLSAIFIVCMQNLSIVKFLHATSPGLSSKVAGVMIAVSWASWFVLSLSSVLTARTDKTVDHRCFIGNGHYHSGFLAVLSIVGILHLVLIIALQIHTIVVIQKQRRFLQRQLQAQVEPHTNAIKLKILQRAIRLSRIISVLLAVTILSWGPFIIGLAVFVLCPSVCGITGDILMAVITFTCINSTVNVFVYRLKSKQFRDAFLNVLWCKNSVGILASQP